MRWFLGCFLLLGANVIAAQSATQDSVAATKSTLRGSFIGLELTSLAEEFGSLRLSFVQGFTNTDLLDLDVEYISDGDGKAMIEGFSSTLQYKKILLAKSLYLGAGAKYMSTNHNEDIILRRQNNAFFQEFEVDQRREALFGLFSLGGFVNIGDQAFIEFEYQFLFGHATYARIEGIPPSSELVRDFDQDDRLVFTTVADQTIDISRAINFNVTFYFRL